MKLIIVHACQAIFGSVKMKWPMTRLFALQNDDI
jgi:hypothetical protein